MGALIRLDVLCECEGCGKQFFVSVDPGANLAAYKDLDDLVQETIRSGEPGFTFGVRGKATIDRFPLTYNVTVQADLVLCDVCSKKCDNFPIEGALTREQVNEALGIPKGTS